MTFLARFYYYVNDEPKKGCAPGLGVSDKDECKEACTNLGISVPNGNWQKDGKPCLAISKKTCKQSKSIGNKAYRICKEEGKMICSAVVYCEHTNFIIYF